MTKRIRFAALLIGLLLPLFLSSNACKKRVAPPPPPPPPAEVPPPPPPPPPPAAPSMSLRAEPSAIQRGESARLMWEASNAETVSIDQGVGTVAVSGQRAVSPAESTTYTATATGPGGTRTASARVTVTEPPRVETPRISDEELFGQNVRDIFFDFDKYDLRPEAQEILRANARALQQYSRWNISIEGHCDDRGTTDYNLALGDRRATAAKEFLASQGISAERVSTLSYGEERPVCTESTEECWAQNRRAHFVLKR